LKEKEAFIEILKAEFEKKVIEEHEKHKSEIDKYKNIVTNLKKENVNQGNKLNPRNMEIVGVSGKIKELKKEIKMLTKESGDGKDKGKIQGMGKGKGKS
jgi:uncharacterized coiled-coil DUF342 family protein